LDRYYDKSVLRAEEPMMIHDIVMLMPKDVGGITLTIVLAGAVLGVVLWLVGSRFSRSLITLCLVLLGGVIGMHLPQWCGWKIEPWAVALGASLVAGICGYVFHRLWVATGVGLVLAAWTAIGIWVAINGNKPWSWPEHQAQTPILEYLRNVYQQLPPDVTHVLAYACGAALLVGLIGALILPRLGLVLLYSTAGVLLMTVLGLLALNVLRPQWVDVLPQRGRSQVGLLAGLVCIGVLVQWYLSPSRKRPPKPAAAPNTAEK
jgi:hypothetical protein